jgi:serine phosphatase RsbU (regulator of sigma subunit)
MSEIRVCRAHGTTLKRARKGAERIADELGEEFGLDRTTTAFERAGAQSAHGLCMDILQAIQNFTRMAPTHNDVTALVLARTAAARNL